MANRLVLNKLDRITLVRKGRAIAKHPQLRYGVVEVVKAGETAGTDLVDESAEEMQEIDRLIEALQRRAKVLEGRIIQRVPQNTPTGGDLANRGGTVQKAEEETLSRPLSLNTFGLWQ